ncbi:MAG: apolipoprotein N-acyltransferase [candidate division Zixibacteria bacterium]|nr:apolipoprotein N-acyltransferase [candidate division Zixibacteria bacterium]
MFWAFLLALAYLPIPFGFLACFALIRPIQIISKLTPKEAFKAGYFYSFMANLFQLYWVAVVTPPGMVAAIFLLSLYPAIILSSFVRLYQWRKWYGLFTLPILWVGMEYFRSLTELSFPWTDLAYSMGYYTTLIQIVSVIGCYGLSLLIMYINVFLWQLFSRSNRMETRVSSFLAVLGICAFVSLYGWVVLAPYPEEGDIEITILQGNVDLATKWKSETRLRNFELYDSLSMTVVDDSVDLIVWPETAAPCYPRVERRYRERLAETARKSGATHLIGALDVVYENKKEKAYNSAFQFSPDGLIDTMYHKVKLVPFSEHVAYQDYLPFLTRDFLSQYLDVIKMHQIQWWSDFYPGDTTVIFEIDKAGYGVLICFESAFPEYVRQNIIDGAEFLVNITNDTWFGRTPGPYQHLILAVFRAVENRVWIARCANSGISAFIDPFGRQIVDTELFTRDVISAKIYPLEGHSTFTKIGPVFGQISSLIMAIILTILLVLWIHGKLTKNR